MKSMLKTLGIAIGILVMLIVGTSLLSQAGRAETAMQTDEDSSDQRTVTVTGIGQANAQPDQAVVRVGVQTEAENAAEALSENSSQMQALLATLQEAGIPEADIQTQFLQLYPRYTQTSQETTSTLAG